MECGYMCVCVWGGVRGELFRTGQNPAEGKGNLRQPSSPAERCLS